MDVEYVALSVAGTLICAIIFTESYLRLRKMFLITVQCWFCHKKTRVRFEDSNSWHCQSCEQYNGFKKDGDYNRIIPAQFQEKYNNCISSVGRSKKDWKQGMSLCESCNYNQELKINQLASFVPLNENHYNEEIEHYRNQLEKSYKLCCQCEVVLSNVLNSQQDMGPRRLIINAITKIQSQSRPILYSTLVLSLLLLLSSVVNLYGLQNSTTATAMKKWFKVSVKSLHWLNNVDFLPDWLKGFNLDLSTTDVSVGLISSGLLIQTVSYIKHRSLWCFLNWISWVLLIFLSWYLNDVGKLVNYLEVTVGVVSFLSTSLVLSKQTSSLQVCYKQQEEMDRKKSPSPVRTECKINKSTKEHSNTPSNLSSPRVTPEKRKPIGRSTLQSPLSESFCNRMEDGDLGIGRLNLGPRLAGSQRRQEPPFQRIQGRDYLKRVSPILTPPKLNLENPLTRSSSYSSGFGSVCGNSFERSNSPHFYDDAYDSTYEPPGYITSYQPYSSNALLQMQPQSPFSPLAYYHIAAQYQRMYLPPIPEKNTSYNSNFVKDGFNLWSVLYLLPMFVLLTSNLALMWTIYSKDLLTAKT